MKGELVVREESVRGREIRLVKGRDRQTGNHSMMKEIKQVSELMDKLSSYAEKVGGGRWSVAGRGGRTRPMKVTRERVIRQCMKG